MSVQVCCWPCPSKYFHVATFAFSSAVSGVVQIQPYTGSFSRFAPSPSFFFFFWRAQILIPPPHLPVAPRTWPVPLHLLSSERLPPFLFSHFTCQSKWCPATRGFSEAVLLKFSPPLSIWEWIDRSIDLAHKWHLTNILSFRVVLISCWPTLLRRYMKNSYLLSDPSKAAGW